MSARARKPVDLTPRLLEAAEAAAYLNVPVKAFVREPIGRVLICGRIRYDRVALDEWLDERRGCAPVLGDGHSEDDADAALARFAQSFERAAGRS